MKGGDLLLFFFFTETSFQFSVRRLSAQVNLFRPAAQNKGHKKDV